MDAINATLDALQSDFSKQTAQGFANAMDAFGLNLRQAAKWEERRWGVVSNQKTGPIPRKVFDSWVYKGMKVGDIATALRKFWTDNHDLRNALRGGQGHCFQLTMPNENWLKDFLIQPEATKQNCGKYERAFALLCSDFKETTGMPSKDGLAYLTSKALDVMWTNTMGCEVKNNNQDEKGFNLSGTQGNGSLEQCSYFIKYPDSCIAIYDEFSGNVCICRSVKDLEMFVEPTRKGGVGSREGMWRLKKNWMDLTQTQAALNDEEL